MNFLVKKIISAMLLPLPISLSLMALGLLLLCFTHKHLLSGLFVFCGFLILIAFSSSFVAQALVHHLESQYPPLQTLPANINEIVVLGGAVGGNPSFPPNTRLSSASLSRLVEAIRLYRTKKESQVVTLVLSGGRVFRSPDVASKLLNTAIVLGINPKHFILENGSRDTFEEAEYLKSMLKDKLFVLVTSAYHMPRAMAMFKKLGMKPIAAPTQYLTGRNRYLISYYFPSSSNLVISDIAIHEYLGRYWANLADQL